jgi:hypothetical protein
MTSPIICPIANRGESPGLEDGVLFVAFRFAKGDDFAV